MFDFGWTELLIIVVVAVLVIGPKELPRALRSLGKWTSRARRMAGDFQRQFNEAIREADLEDVKDQVSSVKSSVGKIDPIGNLRSELTKVGTDIKKDLQSATKIEAPKTDDAKPATTGTGVKPAATAAAASTLADKPEASAVSPPAETAKAETAKTETAKKTTAARKPAAKKTAAKKSTAKKPAARKPAASKAKPAKKPATRKPAARTKTPAAKPATRTSSPAPAEAKPAGEVAKPVEPVAPRSSENAVAGDAET